METTTQTTTTTAPANHCGTTSHDNPSSSSLTYQQCEFEYVRQYLRQCPKLSAQHPAIQAALEGLEKAWKQRERDQKLQAKFGGVKHPASSTITTTSTTSITTTTSTSTGNSTIMMDAVRVEKPIAATTSPLVVRKTFPATATMKQMSQTEDEPCLDDWHEVTEDASHDNGIRCSGNNEDDNNSSNIAGNNLMGAILKDTELVEQDHSSCGGGGGGDDGRDSGINTGPVDTECERPNTTYLGQTLARASITSIAEHAVRVATPLEAIAVALHAALRSDTVAWQCTGVPDTSSGGFAPPVRELPPTQLLPSKWNQPMGRMGDDVPEVIAFRYRKNGVGSVVLRVSKVKDTPDHHTRDEDCSVHITISPTSNTEPSNEVLSFPLKDHINLESWKHARKEQSTIQPALHYKGLALLMSKFVTAFDLGGISDTDSTMTNMQPYRDVTVLNLPTRQYDQVLYPHSVLDPDSGMDSSTRVPKVPISAFQNDPNVAPPGMRVPYPSHYPPGGDFAGDLYPGVSHPPGVVWALVAVLARAISWDPIIPYFKGSDHRDGLVVVVVMVCVPDLIPLVHPGAHKRFVIRMDHPSHDVRSNPIQIMLDLLMHLVIIICSSKILQN